MERFDRGEQVKGEMFGKIPNVHKLYKVDRREDGSIKKDFFTLQLSKDKVDSAEVLHRKIIVFYKIKILYIFKTKNNISKTQTIFKPITLCQIFFFLILYF